jgi:hypothetical protein
MTDATKFSNLRIFFESLYSFRISIEKNRLGSGERSRHESSREMVHSYLLSVSDISRMNRPVADFQESNAPWNSTGLSPCFDAVWQGWKKLVLVAAKVQLNHLFVFQSQMAPNLTVCSDFVKRLRWTRVSHALCHFTWLLGFNSIVFSHRFLTSVFKSHGILKKR